MRRSTRSMNTKPPESDSEMRVVGNVRLEFVSEMTSTPLSVRVVQYESTQGVDRRTLV